MKEEEVQSQNPVHNFHHKKKPTPESNKKIIKKASLN